MIAIKRAYEPPAPEDGERILVDRVWPRGASREHLQIEAWMRDLAPSGELRRWFAHDPARWSDFERRYREELMTPSHRQLLADLAARAKKGVLTLVYGARDTEHNQAVVLRDLLLERAAQHMTARTSYPALDLLLAEHDQCRAHLATADRALRAGLAGSPSAIDAALNEARSLLRFLETQLEVYIAKEEGPLFPRLKAALPAGDRLIDEMVAEHDLIRIKRDDVEAVIVGLLSDHNDVRAERAELRTALTRAAPGSDALRCLASAMETIATKLRVHFENEEELVFPPAPQLVSADTLSLVAKEMAACDPAAPNPDANGEGR